eukprot:2371616-Rhodomonas_salina.1
MPGWAASAVEGAQASSESNARAGVACDGARADAVVFKLEPLRLCVREPCLLEVLRSFPDLAPLFHP